MLLMSLPLKLLLLSLQPQLLLLKLLLLKLLLLLFMRQVFLVWRFWGSNPSSACGLDRPGRHRRLEGWRSR
jgi:hypothetical protein